MRYKTMPSKELRPYSEINKELSLEDTCIPVEMAFACIKNNRGRPCTYANTEMGLKSFLENAQGYFEYLTSANKQIEDEKLKLIPDIEGLSLYLGIDRTTLWRYRDRGGEWERAIDYFKGAIAYCKKQLALRGKIPTVLALFDLVNNHGYVNVSEFKLVQNNPEQQKGSNIDEQLRSAGLVWNEELQEFEPMEG